MVRIPFGTYSTTLKPHLGLPACNEPTQARNCAQRQGPLDNRGNHDLTSRKGFAASAWRDEVRYKIARRVAKATEPPVPLERRLLIRGQDNRLADILAARPKPEARAVHARPAVHHVAM